MERAERRVDDGGAGRAAPLPLLTLVALVTAVTMELVRSSGPLLEYPFDVGIETVAATAIATYLAPGIVVLAIGWGPRGSLASDRLLVGAILLAVIRLAVQGLTNHPRFFVGLVSVALSVAVLTQAVGILAARREGGRAAGAAVALGAGFGVGLQLALGTWDAFWREGPVGWVVTATVVAAMVAAAVVVRRDPATPPVAPAGRVWVLGLTLGLLAMTLGNAAFAASQSDVRLAIAGPVAAVGLLVAGVAASAGRPSPSPRVVRSLLVVAPALTIGGIFWASGPVVLILLVAAQLAVVGALATALELAGDTRIAGSSSLGSAAGSAAVVGLGTIVPLLAFQIDYDLPLGFSNELLIVAAGLVVGVGAWFRRATAPAVEPVGAVIGRSVRMVLSVAAAMVLVGSTAVVGRAVTNEPRSAVASAADQLTLVSWNVHYGVSPEASLDLEEIARSIEEHEPDVVTLQEVSRGWLLGGGADMATWLAERLDMDFVFAPAADRQFGNAILTDLALENAVVVDLPYGEGPQNRSAISADIRVGTATIRVSSVHLQNKDTTPTRLDQVSTLLEAETGNARHIVAGDFNAQPGWDEIERVLDAGYVSAQDVSGDPTALTDPSIDPERRIDWVFGRGVTFIATEVLDDALSSDHLPLVVDFSVGG
ncbi:MAG: endonuclease/exonuclease/phosphatase family protein [Acidimicrobiales bacterium]